MPLKEEKTFNGEVKRRFAVCLHAVRTDPDECRCRRADDSDRLIDFYCSQTAKDALEENQLQTVVDLIVTSIEPQAVNLLIERFPCFREAAEKNELGREIGLYIYYGEGDQDGIEEHENVAPGAYTYVNGSLVHENGETLFKLQPLPVRKLLKNWPGGTRRATYL